MADQVGPANAEHAADARLLGSVHRRLVAWSGGLTLIVLFILGLVIYVAVASAQAGASLSQLEARAELVRSVLSVGGEAEVEELEVAFGGPESGTYAFIVTGDRTIGPEFMQVPSGLPDPDAIVSARAHERDVREVVVSDEPVRILTITTGPESDAAVVQVVQGLRVEQRTLATLVVVLLIGGLLALVAALLLGAAYGRRALVPIRESLEIRRLALRRQRDFAADASHEFRTPLAVIRASVELLRRHPQRPVGTVGTALDDIGAETDRLTQLVADLLLLARSDSGVLDLVAAPLDLADLAAEAVAGQAAVAATADVRLVLDPEPAIVEGDPDRLRRVVVNLVDNAVRHSPSSGTVTVTVRRAGSGASLTVDDEGPGLSDDEAAHVFERFWRAKGAPSGGSGLGLAIAKAIVEGHGGSISVSRAPSGGARFTVALPALD